MSNKINKYMYISHVVYCYEYYLIHIYVAVFYIKWNGNIGHNVLKWDRSWLIN